MYELFSLQDLVKTLSDLYVSYRGRYVISKDGRMFIPHRFEQTCKLTDAAIAAHLQREYAVAVYAGPHASKFVCFDVDVNDKSLVRKLIDGLCDFGFPRERIYVSTSGGKGFHVEMFFTDTVYTNYLIDMYETVCADLQLDTKKVEFRPTSKMSIKLPLSVHGKTGNICWYLDQETLEPIEDVNYVMSIMKIDRDWATTLIRKKRRFEMLDCPEMRREDHFPSGREILPVLIKEGTRHELMVAIGVNQRYQGATQEEIEKVLIDWADNQNQSLIKSSKAEIKDDAARIAAWVCGPKFLALRKNEKSKIFFSQSEIQAMLALSGQIQRRVLFVIAAFCHKYQTAALSAQRISRYVGASDRGVSKAIAHLEKLCLISHISGKKAKAPNRFSLLIPIIAERKIEIDWDFKENTFEEVYQKFEEEIKEHD